MISHSLGGAFNEYNPIQSHFVGIKTFRNIHIYLYLDSNFNDVAFVIKY